MKKEGRLHSSENKERGRRREVRRHGEKEEGRGREGSWLMTQGNRLGERLAIKPLPEKIDRRRVPWWRRK